MMMKCFPGDGDRGFLSRPGDERPADQAENK